MQVLHFPWCFAAASLGKRERFWRRQTYCCWELRIRGELCMSRTWCHLPTNSVGDQRLSGRHQLSSKEGVQGSHSGSSSHDYERLLHFRFLHTRVRETFELNLVQLKSAPSQLLRLQIQVLGFDRLQTCCHSFGPANILLFLSIAG